jgi:hypothetical protein
MRAGPSGSKSFQVMMLKSQTGSAGFADATPLPLTKMTVPTDDDFTYRLESLSGTDFSVVTSEVLKVDL